MPTVATARAYGAGCELHHAQAPTVLDHLRTCRKVMGVPGQRSHAAR
jgi:hypothetical protein